MLSVAPESQRLTVGGLAASAVLTALYSLAYLAGRFGRKPAKKSTRAVRVVIVGAFHNPNWFHAHIVPLTRSSAEQVVVIADEPLKAPPGVRFRCPPASLTRVTGRTCAKFVYLLIAGLRDRPTVFVGYHMCPNAALALMAARMFGVRACYQMTGGPSELLGGGYGCENPVLSRLARPSQALERLAVAVARQFDFCVVRGTGASMFLADRRIDTRRVFTITGSVNIAPAPTASRDYDLVFVGRLTAVKQPWQFVEIVGQVRAAFPAIRAAMIGDGPLLEELKQQAHDLGLDGAIEFLGKRDDVDALLGRCRVFILTSQSEGLSIAMIEAMAAGVVPVVARVGELGDLVSDDLTGYLVEPDRISDYANRVVGLFSNPERWQSLSTAASSIARQTSSVDAVADRWANAFHRVGGTSEADAGAPVLPRRSPAI